jgi:hypothetical protein
MLYASFLARFVVVVVLLSTLLTSLKVFHRHSGFLLAPKLEREKGPTHELSWCRMADRITYRP